MTKKKKALVTGCCGFIGSNLVHRLIAEGWSVEGVDDMSNGNLVFLEPLAVRTIPANLLYFYNHKVHDDAPDLLMIQADFAHEYVLDRIKAGTYDVIFHLAANPRVEYSVERPVETTETNVLKTVGLLYYAIGNVDRVVFSSSAAVYGDVEGELGKLPVSESFTLRPKSPYALQKRICEDYIKLFADLYGLEAVCLRYFNVYGPRQLGDSPYATAISAWCHKVTTDEPLRSDGDGTQTRDMVFIDDVIEANILAAEAPAGKLAGEILNIATGKKYSNNEVLAKFRGKFRDIETVCASARTGYINHTLADISKAYEVLVYEPKVSLDEGLRKTWEWWGL